MRAALIPPKGLETHALASRFHLALALPKLMGRKPYTETYKRAVRLGDYLVLDNGAAEGTLVTPEEIVEAASKLGAHEVVAPDAMLNARHTIELVMSFVKFVEKQKLEYKVMAVAQGTSWNQLMHCVNSFAEMERIQVLGLPRHLLRTLEKRAVRIDLANWIEEKHPQRFEIHLLGTNPLWLSEVRMAAKYAPHIRSVDSSLPFNYAVAGLRLAEETRKGTKAAVVTRPTDYLDADFTNRINVALLRRNIETFLEWVGDDGAEGWSYFDEQKFRANARNFKKASQG